MSISDVHLATEAVAALVDGELSPNARRRALAHTERCAECALAVQTQRDAKRALTSSGGPELPSSLLARLGQIPFTTELQRPGGGSGGRVVVGADGGLLIATERSGIDPRLTVANAVVKPVVATVSAEPARTARTLPSAGPRTEAPSSSRGGSARPWPARPRLRAVQLRRVRRGLVGAAAGLAIGVLSAAAPSSLASRDPGLGPQSPGGNQGNTVVPVSEYRSKIEQGSTQQVSLNPADPNSAVGN